MRRDYRVTYTLPKLLSASEKKSGGEDYHQKYQKQSRKKLYAFTAFTFFATFLYGTFPEKETYARKQFHENWYSEPMRWLFIVSATGFASAFSKSDIYFSLMTRSIEPYMELNYHMVFKDNINAEGKRRVFFRGEYQKDADVIFNDGHHRLPLFWSLWDGKMALPYVKDATLDKKTSLSNGTPNGFTKGLVSLTSCEDITCVYGDAEAMLVVVPMGRVASIAPHVLKESQNSQYEYVCAAIHSKDILGIAYRDPKTHDLTEFKLNNAFRGKIDLLELDSQMLPLIALLPDSDERKSQLTRCVVPELNYMDAYDAHLAEDERHHEEVVRLRKIHLTHHGFNGNYCMQSLRGFFSGARDHAVTNTDEAHFDFQMSALRQKQLFLKSQAHDKQISEQLAKAYDAIYKKDYAETDGPRYFHDIRHISRVTYYVKVLYNLYHANDLTRERLSENDLKLLEIAAIFHDAGRQADGKDYWDKESAALFYRHCVNELHIDHDRAKTFAEAVMNKDFQPNATHTAPLETSYWQMTMLGDDIIWNSVADYSGQKTLAQMILHDADCVDIQRINALPFNKAYLDIDHLGCAQTDVLVEEVKKLIEAQGDPFELTDFNDRTCYAQTMKLIEHNQHEFPMLYRAHQEDYRVAEKRTTLTF